MVARRWPRCRLGGDDPLVAQGPTTPVRDLIQFDLGQATMSIMLAAADLGIGSAHAGVHDQDSLGAPAGLPGPILCRADHPRHARHPPARTDQRPNRRPFNDVVHRDHW